MTVRNLCAHGITAFNRKAITRVTTAAGRNIAKEGDPIKLDKKRFTNYTATVRAFARALADGVTNLPDVKKGRSAPGAASGFQVGRRAVALPFGPYLP
ncbi:hypothetical protein IE4872_CH03098 [Rhizobium gallicum]|uniref:Uncharacterized protein n=1 Tax=Rhizobium gallicum TaxID=56730 RepID=A0A1L5NLI5_9HYPH|nr:hypothetical protein [Rhizobium gallicum]APO68699.1 hypothetical protein IE4872_CH03098 [Rhizobium gallicum]